MTRHLGKARADALEAPRAHALIRGTQELPSQAAQQAT